ncbi:MAG: FG-GAP repeat protein [Planctomycetes bacterium]|nr:FG-GAP repeat protein [Planctomycetota bacterium]
MSRSIALSPSSSLRRSAALALLACGALAAPAPAQLFETHKLLASDGAAGDEFGFATAMDGGVVAVGSRRSNVVGGDTGAVYLYDAASGAQLHKLVANDPQDLDELGVSVALAGGRVVAGAWHDDDLGGESGSAYVFDALTGAQLLKLHANDGAAGDEFGCAVAIDGTLLAVGAKRDDDKGQDSGAVYLFDAVTGAQLLKIVPSDGAADDIFGCAVDLDGGVVAIGAQGDDDNGPSSGSVYLFDAVTGAQLAKLHASDAATFDFFGSALALDAGVVAVGAWANNDFGDHSGSAYLFDAASGVQLAKLLAADGATRDHFGYAIALQGGVVAIGAEGDNDQAFSAGSAYLFDAGTFAQTAKLLGSDSAANDLFGSAVAIENGIVTVGAYHDDDLGNQSGAAYLFDTLATGIGTPYCFGDGSGAPCPCGNSGAAGHGCGGSVAAGALLSATGSRSVGLDDLVLRADDSTPGQPGLFFQGTSAVAGGLGVAFGDGLRCAGGTVVRLQIAAADAIGTAQSSVSVATQGAVSAGQTRVYQWWYRDPAGSACGSAFNLSNGLSVDWIP